MKILFINHSASRTGAPIMLLHFLSWLKLNKSDLINFDVLTLQDHDLLSEFTQVSKNHYTHKKQRYIKSIFYEFIKKLFLINSKSSFNFSKRKLKRIMDNNYDLIYANTVASISHAVYLKKNSNYNTKLLVHFHELEVALRFYSADLSKYIKDIDLSIAASKIVAKNLILNWGFNENNIKIIYEHSKVNNDINKTSNEFIVGASGLVNWRKGSDIFLLVAAYVCNKIPNEKIKFQWVGSISTLSEIIYREDIRKLNLEGKVEFIGLQSEPENFYTNFDLLLMTSREDPFPLVCIECGMLQKPIICFDGATGIQEVIGHLPDTVVPYLDVQKMGDIVIDYFHNPTKKINQGQEMYKIFKEFNTQNQSLKLLETITDLLNEKSI